VSDGDQALASLIGAQTEDIVFTRGGSDADNLAIRGAVLAGGARAHVITQATEHPAVLEACAAFARLYRAGQLPAGRQRRPGRAAHTRWRDRPDTGLVSIMTANSEIGVLQPIAELARIAREHGVLFHTDAAQAAGKIPLDVNALGVDLLTVVGHKMYAPKGIGALYVRPGVRLEPVIYGG
jgi:cysteine desulfurase